MLPTRLSLYPIPPHARLFPLNPTNLLPTPLSLQPLSCHQTPSLHKPTGCSSPALALLAPRTPLREFPSFHPQLPHPALPAHLHAPVPRTASTRGAAQVPAAEAETLRLPPSPCHR